MSSHIPLPKERHSKSKLFVTLSALASKKREHAKVIETHPFNYQLTVIAPQNTIDVQKTLPKHVGWHYRIMLKLSDLIDPAFIANYIKRNTLIALSSNGFIDANDVYAIDGHGKLILSLCKDTYETLGLTGRQAKFPFQRNSRFIVEIDLTASCMDPSKKYFQRIRSRLDDVLGEPVEFDIGYYDAKTGSSLVFDLPGACTHQAELVVRKVPGVLVPCISEKFLDVNRQSEDWVEQAQELFEWIGLASNGSQAIVSDATDSSVCAYSVPEPNTTADLELATISGLLSPKSILSVVEELLAEAQASKTDFFACVWGHEDAPVSWGSSEHGFFVSGENMYAQAYIPRRDRSVTFQACCPWDTFS
ncbi:hypothetical protein H4R20_002795 [Coemansia guatemalensis]|uniref:Uncharacterized protein n=1 Tax=Coemansia guatemalensis TaxID=2761395 RepID=A0A9W8LUN9_9FUNG|nr:hypothetical protein H4R20_002795 [Coemansia guatemalensis]